MDRPATLSLQSKSETIWLNVTAWDKQAEAVEKAEQCLRTMATMLKDKEPVNIHSYLMKMRNNAVIVKQYKKDQIKQINLVQNPETKSGIRLLLVFVMTLGDEAKVRRCDCEMHRLC